MYINSTYKRLRSGSQGVLVLGSESKTYKNYSWVIYSPLTLKELNHELHCHVFVIVCVGTKIVYSSTVSHTSPPVLRTET